MFLESSTYGAKSRMMQMMQYSSRSYRPFWRPLVGHIAWRERFLGPVSRVLTYGTETWAMKAENLHSLKRAEHMMVRWMCGVSLKERKRSEVLYSLLGVQSMAKVVRCGRLRWFGHVECKNGDDWVSACRNVVVAGARCVGRDRKTWRECVKDDTDELGLHPE